MNLQPSQTEMSELLNLRIKRICRFEQELEAKFAITAEYEKFKDSIAVSRSWYEEKLHSLQS